MRRNLVIAAAASAALFSAVLPVTASAADDPNARVRAAATTSIEICISGTPEFGTGQFSIDSYEGEQVAITKRLGSTLNDANNQTGLCHLQAVAADTYIIQPGKYMSAQCMQTVNGHPMNPPAFTADRCRAVVHHWHVSLDDDDDPTNALPAGRLTSTIETPNLTVVVSPNNVTRISAHVVDERYPDCTEEDPMNTPTNPQRVCEPTPGPTT